MPIFYSTSPLQLHSSDKRTFPPLERCFPTFHLSIRQILHSDAEKKTLSIIKWFLCVLWGILFKCNILHATSHLIFVAFTVIHSPLEYDSLIVSWIDLLFITHFLLSHYCLSFISLIYCYAFFFWFQIFLLDRLLHIGKSDGR